jgi:hypothetical protein
VVADLTANGCSSRPVSRMPRSHRLDARTRPFGPRSFITPNEAGATVSAAVCRLVRRRHTMVVSCPRLSPGRRVCPVRRGAAVLGHEGGKK